MKTLVSEEEKIALIEEKFRDILDILGLDSSHSTIKDTPARVAKMYVKELFSGLDPENYPKLSFSDFAPPEYSSYVLVKNISLQSYCEHHFVPMVGHAHIAYLPQKKVIGLSKLNRIADYFAKRPQLQERLTAQIAENLCEVLETEDVAVYTIMSHFCVQMRGIKDKDSFTHSYVLLGKFQDEPNLRSEFILSGRGTA
ncbi:MAG TPA: GTP cyclohydrolase I FolE [Chlamydiales bacterium]|nr:GTP cyclohydrolase I FolE [Chlamydiales bacterium]